MLNKKLSELTRCIVIAEAGVNHLGRSDYAEKLVTSAKAAGADVIKFQTYKAEKLTTKHAERFWSWSGEVNPDGNQIDSYSRLDKFSLEQYEMVVEICRREDIEFMSTPFDLEAVELLEHLGVNYYKVASCDITNKSLLEAIARTRKPVFLSTGASEIREIRRAYDLLLECGASEVCIMHCTLCYPTGPEDANLGALRHLQVEFPGTVLGFSDHTLSTKTPSIAVALGAKVVEKHFTFDKSLPLSADHWLSVDEIGMRELVTQIREVEELIGDGAKRVLDCEILARTNARRSLVPARKIRAGETIRSEDLIAKRPGTGVEPFDLDAVVGKRALRDLGIDDLISLGDFQ
jgi:sialic acid synthase SpsE